MSAYSRYHTAQKQAHQDYIQDGMLWGFQVWFPLLGIRNLDSRWFWWIANQIQLWVQTFYHQSRLPGFTPPGSKHLRGDVVQFRGFFLKLKLTRKIILYFRTSKSLWWWRSLANELVLVNLSWTWIIVLVRIQSQYISKSGTLFVYLDHPLLFT